MCCILRGSQDISEILRAHARERASTAERSGQVAQKKRAKGYKKLRDSLIDNLLSRGITEDVFTDKVQEYMDLWQRRQELEEDIEERGIVIEDAKRGGLVENRSVSLEVQISRQMLAIFKALGFEEMANAVNSGGGDDDEL